MQSRSIAGFILFIVKRRTEDNLPAHIKGAARWNEANNLEGYEVFDLLSQTYLKVEYDKDNRQWYFIQQDTRSSRCIATQPVPSTYHLGRQSIAHVMDQAADVDNDNRRQDNQQSSMATQTATMPTVTAAAALTFVGTKTGQVQSFFRMKKPGSGLPGGSGGPPGAPGSGVPGAPGAIFGHTGPGGGGRGKLGGNPPQIFNRDRSRAHAFMTAFNLYRLANHNTDHITSPMKHVQCCF
jgi:hypothetical protein